MKLWDTVRIVKPCRPKIGVISNIFDATSVDYGKVEVTFKDLSKSIYPANKVAVIMPSSVAPTSTAE